MSSLFPRRWTLALAAALLLLASSLPSQAAWETVDGILSEAYGPEVARECQEYYGSIQVPEEQMAHVLEAIRRLVEAGYPSGCPSLYLKLVADLVRAGIGLNDLTNKIKEGIAKRVPPDRLNAVLGQRTDALKEARILVLKLEQEGARFLDRQMAYTVFADYLLRGVPSAEMSSAVLEGRLGRYPALENVIR